MLKPSNSPDNETVIVCVFIATSKVAFLAGLGRVQNHGPFNTNTILAYNDVHTNFGNAYSPNTGTVSELLYAQVKSVCARACVH